MIKLIAFVLLSSLSIQASAAYTRTVRCEDVLLRPKLFQRIKIGWQNLFFDVDAIEAKVAREVGARVDLPKFLATRSGLKAVERGEEQIPFQKLAESLTRVIEIREMDAPTLELQRDYILMGLLGLISSKPPQPEVWFNKAIDIARELDTATETSLPGDLSLGELLLVDAHLNKGFGHLLAAHVQFVSAQYRADMLVRQTHINAQLAADYRHDILSAIESCFKAVTVFESNPVATIGLSIAYSCLAVEIPYFIRHKAFSGGNQNLLFSATDALIAGVRSMQLMRHVADSETIQAMNIQTLEGLYTALLEQHWGYKSPSVTFVRRLVRGSHREDAVLDASGVAQLELNGYRADDHVGTLPPPRLFKDAQSELRAIGVEIP